MSYINAIKQLIEKTISENGNSLSLLKSHKNINVEIEKGVNDNELILKFHIDLNGVNSIGKKFIISKTYIDTATYETINYPSYIGEYDYKLNTDDLTSTERGNLISDMDGLLKLSCSISKNKSLTNYLLELLFMYRKEITN